MTEQRTWMTMTTMVTTMLFFVALGLLHFMSIGIVVTGTLATGI